MTTDIRQLPLRLHALTFDPDHQRARDEFYAGAPGKRLLRDTRPISEEEVEKRAVSEPLLVWDDDVSELRVCKFASNHEAAALMRQGWELIER